jgi:hypothetical protein
MSGTVRNVFGDVKIGFQAVAGVFEYSLLVSRGSMKKAHGLRQAQDRACERAWARGSSRPTTAGPRRGDRSSDTAGFSVIIRTTGYLSISVPGLDLDVGDATYFVEVANLKDHAT